MKKIWSFLSLIEKEEHEKTIEELQSALWGRQEEIFKELEEARYQNKELTQALSEMVYVATYSPDQRCTEKLAVEKTALFYPILSTPELKASNKRTLSLLLESTKPPRSPDLFQILQWTQEKEKKRKRQCCTRECLSCGNQKQTKCYQYSFHVCNSCMYRKDFPRGTVKSCDEA